MVASNVARRSTAGRRFTLLGRARTDAGGVRSTFELRPAKAGVGAKNRAIECQCPDLPKGGVMKLPATAMERAFELAKSGSCASLDDLKKRLKEERYSTAQITGGVLSKQLRLLIQTALTSQEMEPAKKPSLPVDEQDG
jgi:hypothetical protein